MDNIIKRLTFIQEMLNVNEEIEKGDLSTFTKTNYHTLRFSKRKNKKYKYYYANIRKKMFLNGEKIYEITFQYSRDKYTPGTEEFIEFVQNKWKKIKKVKKYNIEELIEEQKKWNELYSTINLV
jgi:hypothetical protein